jgi:hypothetical protein
MMITQYLNTLAFVTNPLDKPNEDKYQSSHIHSHFQTQNISNIFEFTFYSQIKIINS